MRNEKIAEKMGWTRITTKHDPAVPAIQKGYGNIVGKMEAFKVESGSLNRKIIAENGVLACIDAVRKYKPKHLGIVMMYRGKDGVEYYIHTEKTLRNVGLWND